MPAPTLEGRLICASVCAYAAVTDGPVGLSGSEPYAGGAGFTTPPTAIVGGNAAVDACIVGRTPLGVVVAFRGTLPFDIHRFPTLRDWLGDFNALPVASLDHPGRTHRGFLASVSGLWGRLADEVTRQRAGGDGLPLLLTGHSKGGAMAALAAWRFQQAGLPVRVVTFAAPKPGDSEFRDAYRAVDHTRYEYADDIVPHLPASQGGFIDTLASLPFVGDRFAGLERFDYQAAGTLRFIDWAGEVGPETDSLAVERRLSLVQLLVRGQLSRVAADHSILCGGGYLSAVCPEGVCPGGA
jgi:hypothetical protein